jgi:hypothetical protein
MISFETTIRRLRRRTSGNCGMSSRYPEDRINALPSPGREDREGLRRNKKKSRFANRYGRLQKDREIIIFVFDEVITSVLRNEIRSKSKGDALWKFVPPFFPIVATSF